MRVGSRRCEKLLTLIGNHPVLSVRYLTVALNVQCARLDGSWPLWLRREAYENFSEVGSWGQSAGLVMSFHGCRSPYWACSG